MLPGLFSLVPLLLLPLTSAILPVQDNEIREVRSLDGTWTFVREETNAPDAGIPNEWFKRDLATFANASVMPVPSAFNDLEDEALRDHVGWVWYQKIVSLPAHYSQSKLYLRFDSVNYYAKVYLNGVEVGSHIGGHLPFELPVSDLANFGAQNRITVAVNNRLSHQTIPQGIVSTSGGRAVINPYFDFFPYSGILRPVHLLIRPSTFISEQHIVAEANGTLTYRHTVTGKNYSSIHVIVSDEDGKTVLRSPYIEGQSIFETVNSWWPRGMGKPYLYTMTSILYNDKKQPIDLIRTTFGFRSITFDNEKMFWNGKPFYCKGYGMHEEADIRGRAYDPVLMIKDHNLLEWTGANCYRTSHYPYSEERIFDADRRGIAIILESPGVGINYFSDTLRTLHEHILREMITRDRNHPSIFMWSVANEPAGSKPESRAYFEPLAALVRSLDPTRPVTAVLDNSPKDVKVADLFDVICFNRYNGWYQGIGNIGNIENAIMAEVEAWNRKFNRPVIITEYGAEAIPGFHKYPPTAFTEEYQVEVIKRHHEAFDKLISQNQLAGEMVWVFADFMTKQDTTRVVGNHKGMFTRQRDPKMSAHALRERYTRKRLGRTDKQEL